MVDSLTTLGTWISWNVYIVGFDQLQLVCHPARLKGAQFLSELTLLQLVIRLQLQHLHEDLMFSFRDTLSIYSLSIMWFGFSRSVIDCSSWDRIVITSVLISFTFGLQSWRLVLRCNRDVRPVCSNMPKMHRNLLLQFVRL